jgi:hypothetical protein
VRQGPLVPAEPEIAFRAGASSSPAVHGTSLVELHRPYEGCTESRWANGRSEAEGAAVSTGHQVKLSLYASRSRVSRRALSRLSWQRSQIGCVPRPNG